MSHPAPDSLEMKDPSTPNPSKQATGYLLIVSCLYVAPKDWLASFKVNPKPIVAFMLSSPGLGFKLMALVA